MIAIKRITTETALLFKDIRLRALQESPWAFGSTHAKEAQLSDEDWMKRAARWGGDRTDAIFLAFDGETPCGIVGSYVEEGQPQTAHVISMWVDPAYRRASVGNALIDGVIAWNLSIGASGLKLMVTSVNQGAIAFYVRMGFRMTGATGPYPNDPAIIEYEMALAIS